MKKNLPLIVLFVVAIVIVGSIVVLESKKTSRGSFILGDERVDINLNDNQRVEQKAKKYDKAKEIVAPAGFLNTDGKEITIQELIGKKVILIDFWTYSCINCQRTLPYLTSWYEKYEDEGLEIIGMHTPEFEFEKDPENVQGAIDKWGIEYPVVQDNDFGTWRNYNNRYWPRKYIIDIDGFIVYDHIGEGAYDETEKVIQELLKERMEVLEEQGEVSSGIVDPENVEKVNRLPRSPETYFGALRNINFGNGEKGSVGVQDLEATPTPRKDILYLDGEWDIQGEYSESQVAGNKIIFNYQAEKVFLVASAAEDVSLTIKIDGKEVGNLAGSDLVDGQVIINDEKLYRLIEDPNGNSNHVLEITVNGSGMRAFAFTFG